MEQQPGRREGQEDSDAVTPVDKLRTPPVNVNVDPPDDRGLAQEACLDHVVPDPANIPDVIVLAGFLGRGSTPTLWRLYESLDLTVYAEIRDADILYSVKYALQPPNQELTRSVLWIRRNATIARVTRGPLVADFLQGSIAASAGGMHGGGSCCGCPCCCQQPMPCAPCGHGGHGQPGGGGGGPTSRWPC